MMEPYIIPIFSNEWWINNAITFLVIFGLLFVGKILDKKNKLKTYSYIIGILLLVRTPWSQWYQCQIGQWNAEWSIPLQMCSLSALFSGMILIVHNLKIRSKQY